MLNRLKFPLAVLTLTLFAAWAPSVSHAQAVTDPGQQGEFQGEHVDTGAAAVDLVNEKEAPETSEAAAATAARTSVSAASSPAAEAADSEPAESSTDLDRVEDQVGDQTAPDPLAR
jgi:uncharacterized iron-regulated membrane protein